MLDMVHSAEECVGSEARASLSLEEWQALLALRGLLAGRIMLHCLQQRHAVQYGINRCGWMDAAVLAALAKHVSCALVLYITVALRGHQQL